MENKELFVDIILPVPVDQSFTYRITSKQLDNEGNPVIPGMRVLVPFGSRMLVGIIRKIGVDKPAIDIKPINQLIDHKPSVSKPLMSVLEWASSYYMHPVGDVFKQFIPHKGARLELNKFYNISRVPYNSSSLTAKELELLEHLDKRKHISKNRLLNKFGINIINRLEKLGIIESYFKGHDNKEPGNSVRENEYTPVKYLIPDVILTAEQNAIIEALQKSFNSGIFSTNLIMGITGSGKTEIYLRLIHHAIEQGKNAIVLVPEIALAPQMLERFKNRFGELVGIMHSGVQQKELIESQQKILSGRIRIVIGVRSAVFAPIKNVGVIIVDEEHSSTYKQEDRFKYNARDVAIMRGKFEQAIVVLGSATPSMESYYNAVTGKYRLYKLTKRINDLPMPEIHVIDLKRDHPHRIGNELLAKPVMDALSDTISKGKQAIIMLNKRGFSSSLVCEDCGYTEHCPYCELSLTYHKTVNKLKCHYCGYETNAIGKCPSCGSVNLKPVGTGTQRIEEELKHLFKNVPLVRLDRDTTVKPGSHEQILNTFGSGEAIIMLGTQMVSKGFDFPKVDLVCLPLLDIGLNLPDFRGAEHVFNIITQSAGRAGRLTSGAKVYIQTYNPEYYAIKFAVNYDTQTFYERELKYRKELDYPPFSRLVLLLFKHKKLEKLENAMPRVTEELKAFNNRLTILGPAPAPLIRVKGFYIYNVLLKAHSSKTMSDVLYTLNKNLKRTIGNIITNFDVDPQHFL